MGVWYHGQKLIADCQGARVLGCQDAPCEADVESSHLDMQAMDEFQGREVREGVGREQGERKAKSFRLFLRGGHRARWTWVPVGWSQLLA